MFCRQCGRKMEDGARFCPHCGAAAETAETPVPGTDLLADALVPQPMTDPAAAGPAMGGTVPPAENGRILGAGKKRRSLGLPAAIGGAVIAAAAAAVILLSGLLGGPKAALAKAALKSVNAWQSAAQAVGLPDMGKLAKNRQITQELSLRLKSVSDEVSYYYSDLSALEGLGVRMTEGINLPDRKMDLSAALSYGSSDVLSGWLCVDNDTVTLGSPEFLDSGVYGFSTETLGRDLVHLSDEIPEELEDISFNLFDLIETFSKPVEVDKAALKELADAIEAEKTGKVSMDINDHNVDCTGYHVIIPKSALRDWVNAVEDAYKDRGLDDAVIDMLRSFGVPGDELSEIRGDLEDSLNGREMFDSLKEIIKAVGDVELDVYLSGGYIAAVEWEDKIEGEKAELGAFFGGGKNYADDMSLELRISDARVRLSSTGSHSAAGGTYTDETTFRVQAGGGNFSVKSEVNYQPKKSADNFEWTVKGEGFSLTAEGQLEGTKDSLSMELDKLAVSAMGMELVRLEAGYAIRPYEALSRPSKAPAMLAEMDEEDMMELCSDVSANAQSWALDMLNDMPALVGALNGLF